MFRNALNLVLFGAVMLASSILSVDGFSVAPTTTTRSSMVAARSTSTAVPSSSKSFFLLMASDDNQTDKSVSTLEVAQEESTGGSKYKNLSTNEEIDVEWTDNAMAANTNPFLLSWWGYIIFGLPFVLLLDDAFHFIPSEGPLSFLKQL